MGKLSSSITESILNSMDGLKDDYLRVIHEPGKILEEKEAELRSIGGFIHSFEEVSILAGRSLVAVDGGRASQQLSGGDLIAAGATLADGIRSVPAYLEPIAEGDATIVPHTSDNESAIGARLMGGMELRILDRAEVDHIIIDGAYLGNVSEILYGLIAYKKNPTDFLIRMNQDGRLNNAILKVLQPDVNAFDRIFAVPKSDSSYVQSKEVFGENHPIARQISDRALATRILQPGEFMKPRALQTNHALLSSFPTDLKGYPKEIQELLEGKLQLLKQLGGGWDRTVPDRLYVTYFKPTRWEKMDRALKLEFVSFNSSEAELIEHARNAVEIVNDDTVDNIIMEPYSQYVADRRAKDAGPALEASYHTLLNATTNMEEANSIIRNYRT